MSKKLLLGLLLGLSVYLTTSQAEVKNLLTGSVLTDFVQHLNQNDQYSELVVSEVTLNNEIELNQLTKATVRFIAEENMEAISFEEARVDFCLQKDSPFTFTIGQALLPFGLLNTHLISDPLILDAPGIEVETIRPTVMFKWETTKFLAQTGFYKENKMEAGAIKIGGNVGDNFYQELSARLLRGAKRDYYTQHLLQQLNDVLTKKFDRPQTQVFGLSRWRERLRRASDSLRRLRATRAQVMFYVGIGLVIGALVTLGIITLAK